MELERVHSSIKTASYPTIRGSRVVELKRVHMDVKRVKKLMSLYKLLDAFAMFAFSFLFWGVLAWIAVLVYKV